MKKEMTVLHVQCHHCNETLRISKPKKAGIHYFICPKCKQKFGIETKEDTVETQAPLKEEAATKQPQKEEAPETHVVTPTKSGKLCLYRKRRLRSDERYELQIGTNVIGIKNDEAPSDIMVADDFMSRRSASIVCDMPASGSFHYLFTLIRSSNPAFLNEKQIPVGTSIYLKEGDVFKLGKTTFYVKHYE